MKRIKLHDKEFELFLTYPEICEAVKNIARLINEDLKNADTPLFLSILNGSFMFAGDLMKHIELDCELSFMKLSSYIGTNTSEKVNRLIGLDTDVEGRTVVVIEDVVDSGITLEYIVDMLSELKPKELKIATLLFKPDSYSKNLKIDYIGLRIPNNFIVGYGLDYNESGRNRKDIYKLVE